MFLLSFFKLKIILKASDSRFTIGTSMNCSFTASIAATIRNWNAWPKSSISLEKLKIQNFKWTYPIKNSPRAHKWVLPEIWCWTFVVIVIKQFGHVIRVGFGPTWIVWTTTVLAECKKIEFEHENWIKISPTWLLSDHSNWHLLTLLIGVFGIGGRLMIHLFTFAFLFCLTTISVRSKFETESEFLQNFLINSLIHQISIFEVFCYDKMR